MSLGCWAAIVWEDSPESRWGQRGDDVLVVDYSVDVLDVFVVPCGCCRVEHSGRSTSDNLYMCLRHIRITDVSVFPGVSSVGAEKGKQAGSSWW